MRILSSKPFVPDWEKPCWLHAINKTLGTPESRIAKLARKDFGWDGVTKDMALKYVVMLLQDIIGQMPNFDLTREYANKVTARNFSGKTKARGLVFVNGHVMPMVNGVVSNFNGYGSELIKAVATY